MIISSSKSPFAYEWYLSRNILKTYILINLTSGVPPLGAVTPDIGQFKSEAKSVAIFKVVHTVKTIFTFFSNFATNALAADFAYYSIGNCHQKSTTKMGRIFSPKKR